MRGVLCVQASISGPVLRQKGEYLLSSSLHKVITSKNNSISVHTYMLLTLVFKMQTFCYNFFF